MLFARGTQTERCAREPFSHRQQCRPRSVYAVIMRSCNFAETLVGAKRVEPILILSELPESRNYLRVINARGRFQQSAEGSLRISAILSKETTDKVAVQKVCCMLMQLA